MNRRGFLGHALAGAVLASTRWLPVPAAPVVSDALPFRGQPGVVTVFDDAGTEYACRFAFQPLTPEEERRILQSMSDALRRLPRADDIDTRTTFSGYYLGRESMVRAIEQRLRGHT